MRDSKSIPHIQSSASGSKSAADEDNNKSARCERSARHAASATSGDKAAEETPYEPFFANIARFMCMNGAARWELAHIFEVDESTIGKWKRRHKDFAAACKCGINFADGKAVRSLAQLALGYDYYDVKIFHHRGQTIYARYLVHVPANVEAAKHWLANRRPEEWGHKSEFKQNIKPNSELARAMENTVFDTFRPKED